jgi:hypothetical protein
MAEYQRTNADISVELSIDRIRVPTVKDQPTITLRSWRVIQESGHFFYLFGFHPNSNRFRMTTPIAALDFVQRRWVTASGRTYHTDTMPGEPFGEGVMEWLGEFHNLRLST